MKKLFDWLGTRQKLNSCQAQQQCEDWLQQEKIAVSQYKALFADRDSYVDPAQASQWAASAGERLEALRSELAALSEIAGGAQLTAAWEEWSELLRTLGKTVEAHNARVVRERLAAVRSWIGPVEGRELDEQQLLCIAKQGRNHLVLAGAGTGKTTTVIGKIKLLLAAGFCQPQELLVLSFTNASASEMHSRIRQETGVEVEASTFHKLGMNILRQTRGTAPRLTALPLRSFIRDRLAELLEDPHHGSQLTRYLLFYQMEPKSEFAFRSGAEYRDYLRLHPPVSLRGEWMESYGELEIANFLSLYGLDYVYTPSDSEDIPSRDRTENRSEFYLPRHQIRIAYFSMDRENRVPSYFTGRSGKSAARCIWELREGKRADYRENGQRLIECYAYEKEEGSLQRHLARKLQEAGVKLQPTAPQKLWETAPKALDEGLRSLSELLETAITLMKGNGDSVEQLQKRISDHPNRSANLLLLSLLESIYGRYQAELRDRREIDFNDMIHLAAEEVDKGAYVSPYRYVIVDEYQDISQARFRLLESLRRSREFDLFCVGDDWQSIYRFAGSDVGYILNFERYWGPTLESRIETTYRFTDSLIEVSGWFIMQNPRQRVKHLRGCLPDKGFALEELRAGTDREAALGIGRAMEGLPPESTVFLIGRYNFDGKILEGVREFSLEVQPQSGIHRVRYEKRPDLDIRFLTAHRSKGLQADYVFILNNRNGRTGFPSQVQSAPFLELLMGQEDDDPLGEERRLFYVAMTRARKKVFLVIQRGRESQFVQELRQRYPRQLRGMC